MHSYTCIERQKRERERKKERQTAEEEEEEEEEEKRREMDDYRHLCLSTEPFSPNNDIKHQH